MTTAGTRVDAATCASGTGLAGVGDAGVGAGAGAVATVAGAEQAMNATARRTSGEDFIRKLIGKGILQG
jgi:hypothetical protein